MTLLPRGMEVRPTLKEDPLYRIDPAFFEEQGLCLDQILRLRRCPFCQDRLRDRPPGSVSLEEHLEGFLDCCARRRDFIRPGTPLLEAVFRILLAAQNRPASLSTLYVALHDWWGGHESPRYVDPERLKALLDRDLYYGIRRVGEASAPQD